MNERLVALFTGLRARSRTSLRQALDIAEEEGVSATLIVHIPAKAGQAPEIYLTTGPVQVVHDLTRPPAH